MNALAMVPPRSEDGNAAEGYSTAMILTSGYLDSGILVSVVVAGHLYLRSSTVSDLPNCLEYWWQQEARAKG